MTNFDIMIQIWLEFKCGKIVNLKTYNLTPNSVDVSYKLKFINDSRIETIKLHNLLVSYNPGNSWDKAMSKDYIRRIWANPNGHNELWNTNMITTVVKALTNEST